VDRYTVTALQDMKANHERLAYESPSLWNEEIRFLDRSLDAEWQQPENLGQLDLSYCEEPFFTHAHCLIERIAQLPQLTRSLYAHALIHAIAGDLYLCVGLLELEQRLGQPYSVMEGHFGILEKANLVTAWEAWEEDRHGLHVLGRRYCLRGLDREDCGIYFLYLVHKRFSANPSVLIDLIENLNFTLLDL